MTAPLIRLDRAAKVYSGPSPVTALKPATLTVDQGEYVAVVGRSGSGKSTLLNIIGLLDKPTSGSYELLGNEVAAMSDVERTSLRARQIGFVFQTFHLLPYRTALENVAMALLYTHRDRRERRWIASRTLDAVGLQHRTLAIPTTMSGGERQRVAIARAIVSEPALLLCDEPTGNLDSTSAADVLDLIEHLNKQGTTVMLITHDKGVAARAHRTLVISDGFVTAA